MRIVVVYAAPVPVGHRVRVTWHQKVQRGLVASQVRTEDRPHQPRVTDLDTGVTYETDWAVGHGGRSVPDSPNQVADDALPDFRVERTVEGVVRACRVVTIRDGRSFDVQTHLWIEPAA